MELVTSCNSKTSLHGGMLKEVAPVVGICAANLGPISVKC